MAPYKLLLLCACDSFKLELHLDKADLKVKLSTNQAGYTILFVHHPQLCTNAHDRCVQLQTMNMCYIHLLESVGGDLTVNL